MPVDPRLLEILICPACRAAVSPAEDGGQEGLKCGSCRRLYPIRDGIPVMLVDEASVDEG